MEGGHCPFSVRDEIEVLSHLLGYRGGWFRCAVQRIRVQRSNQVSLYISHVDFPDQPLEWIDMYQAYPQQPLLGKALMCRPMPPRFVTKGEVGDVGDTDFVAIVNEVSWKPGEKVEWLYQDIWWKMEIKFVMDDGLVKVVQEWPPYGERLKKEKYLAKAEHLRPALNWTVEGGWSVETNCESLSNFRVVLVDLSQPPYPISAEDDVSGITSSEGKEAKDAVDAERSRPSETGGCVPSKRSPDGDGDGDGEEVRKRVYVGESPRDEEMLMPLPDAEERVIITEAEVVSVTEEAPALRDDVKQGPNQPEAESGDDIAAALGAWQNYMLHPVPRPMMPGKQKQGMKVKIECEGADWNVVCIDHRGDIEIELPLVCCKFLESASAAAVAVRTKIVERGLDYREQHQVTVKEETTQLSSEAHLRIQEDATCRTSALLTPKCEPNAFEYDHLDTQIVSQTCRGLQHHGNLWNETHHSSFSETQPLRYRHRTQHPFLGLYPYNSQVSHHPLQPDTSGVFGLDRLSSQGSPMQHARHGHIHIERYIERTTETAQARPSSSQLLPVAPKQEETPSSPRR